MDLKHRFGQILGIAALLSGFLLGLLSLLMLASHRISIVWKGINIVVAALLVETLFELATFVGLSPFTGQLLLPLFSWPTGFAAWEWLSAALQGAVVVACAVIVFLENPNERPSEEHGDRHCVRHPFASCDHSHSSVLPEAF